MTLMYKEYCYGQNNTYLPYAAGTLPRDLFAEPSVTVHPTRASLTARYALDADSYVFNKG